MPDSHKIEIAPGGTFRRPAGPYDLKTRLPRYEVDVLAVDADAGRQVVVDSEIMGRVENYTWIWKITNKSTLASVHHTQERWNSTCHILIR